MNDKKEIGVANSLDDIIKGNVIKAEIGDPISALTEENIIDVSSRPIPPVMSQSSESASQRTSFCSSPLQSIPITYRAFSDLFILADAVNKVAEEEYVINDKFEVYCYLLGEKSDIKEDEPNVVTEIYIPEHTARPNHVDVDERAVIELGKYIRENDKVLLGWAHSHGKYNAYSSKTDDENHRRILAETSNYFNLNGTRVKYIYEITVNSKHDAFGVVLTQFPCTYISQNNDCEINVIGDPPSEEEEEERFYEIVSEVKRKVMLEEEKDLDSDDLRDAIIEETKDLFTEKVLRMKDELLQMLTDDEKEDYEEAKKIISKYDSLLVESVKELADEIASRVFDAIKNIKNGI